MNSPGNSVFSSLIYVLVLLGSDEAVKVFSAGESRTADVCLTKGKDSILHLYLCLSLSLQHHRLRCVSLAIFGGTGVLMARLTKVRGLLTTKRGDLFLPKMRFNFFALLLQGFLPTQLFRILE